MRVIKRRFLALALLISLVLSTAAFGQSSNHILERKTGDRFITLVDFPIHPAILVAVSNAKGVMNGRGTDLVPRWKPESSGRAEEYYQFVATRLKPYVDAHFRTKPEARYSGIVGNSLGGLAAFYFGYRHPETFGLAGCMSPSFWTADSQLIRDVASNGRRKHTTRFWIDGGEKDAADIEILAPRMTRLLIDKGWREGDDVAFQLGYGHTHGRTAMRERLRDVLYFLLRREPPAIRGIALKPLADPGASTLDLSKAGDRAYVRPEVRYEHGFYLNSEPQPRVASASARFATAFDDRFVYVAIAVKDSRLVIRPDKPSAEQDGVEVWLDARSDPMRAESKAQADGYQATFLLARVSPALSPSTAVPIPVPSLRSALPKDLKRACRLTADGYDAEIAIPVEYLNRMQGDDWRQFRLNVHLTDFVAAGEPKLDLWWQPFWRSMESLAGCGTFERR